jgi:metallo-beta-lactamase family protein
MREPRIICEMKEALVAHDLDEERIICPKLDDEVELLDDNKLPTFKSVEHRLPAETPVEQDWHNDLAQFTFDLREAFEQAADDKSRAKFLRRLRRALKNNG